MNKVHNISGAGAQEKIAELENRLARLSEQYAHTQAECERLRQAHAAVALALDAEESTNLAELLDAFSGQLLAMPHVGGCVINLINEEADALVTAHLKLPAEFDGLRNTYRGFQYPIGQTDVNVLVFKDGKARVVTETDLDLYAENTRLRFERWKMRNLLVLPISVKRKDGSAQPIGTVMLFSQHHFLDLQLAGSAGAIESLFAKKIALYWSHQQAVESAKTAKIMYAEIQQFIAYITGMNSLTTVEEVYLLISEQFLQRFRFDFVGILLEEQHTLGIVHTAFGAPYRHLAASYVEFEQTTRYNLNSRDGASAMAFVNNQRLLFEDCVELMHLPMSEKDRKSLTLLQTLRTFLTVPIRLNDKPIGVLWLGTLGETMDLRETSLALIELLASFISTAIRNAQTHGLVGQQKDKIGSLNQALQGKIVQLDEIARKDRLTGLNNFGNFEEELKRRASEYARIGEQGALSMILIDVDRFKLFNDTYGHPAGNQVLQEVAARTLKCVRDMDFVARYGGEEFAVLLPQCDLAGAHRIAERVRAKMANDSFIVDGQARQVSISGGCAQFNHLESAEDFLCRVDAALYAAKHNGRNRIEKALPFIDRDKPQQE